MKRLLLAVALLPLVSFGSFEFQGWNVERMRIFKYTSFGVTDLPTRAITVYPSSVDDLSSALSASTFGFCVTLSPSVSQKMLAPIPTSSRFFVFDSWASNTTITNSLFFNSPSNCVVSAHYIPSVSAIYYSASLLYINGYRGSGIVDDFSSGLVHCVNVNYPTLVADIVSSTNTVYRQILFSYLAQINNSLTSIQTSVNNVNVDLGQFQNDYAFVNSSHFDISNVIDSAAADSVIPSRVATSLKSLARYPFNHDYINSVLDTYRSSQWLPLAFSDSDLASPLHNDSRVKQGLKNLGDSFGAGASYHYTTPLTNELQKLNTNWVSQAKAALADNTLQITNQLAHMFDDTPNGIGRVMRDTANSTLSAANAAGSIDERLQRGITVAVVNEGNTSVGVHLDGPVNIDSTQWQTLSTPLGSVSSLLDSLYGDFSTFYGFGNSNYDWSHFFDLVQSFKNQNHIDLAAISSQSVTGDVSRIYDYLSGYQSNILYEIAASITNSWDDYYFTRFRRANEFIDESETAFSISAASDEVFGNGFDEQEFANLNWFSRVELLLYQLQKANDTTNVLESADLEGEFDDSVQRFNLAGTNFVAASVRVVNLFGFISRFADSVKLAFQSSASPVTDGIVLMQGGSWLVNEPLILRVPIAVQNALRLVFQCIWYLSAFVIGWRIVVVTWDKVVTLVRWLWSVFDV